MPTSTLDAESLATSPADIISFGEKDGADPRAIAEALQSHRDNIASWASENITDPADWWEGVQKLDTDTADGLQKMRASHLRSTVAKELPDARDQQNFLYELQASGFDPDSMPAEYKPVVDAYKNALADEVFKGARRRLNGKIRNGDQTLAYFDMVDNGEKGESIDVVLKFPNIQTGGEAFRSFTAPADFANIDETIKSNATIGEVKSSPSFATEKISIPNATEKEAQDEAVRLDQEAAQLRKQADSLANQKPSVLGQEADAGYGASVMADQFKAQVFDLEQQARYLKENGRVGLITNRVREALKESSSADKIGQGLLAGMPGEFAKGLATASIDLGVLNQRIQGDEAELKQLVQGKSELDTALEGASRARFAGNVVSRGIASGVESLGTMAPFLAGGIATRGFSSAATRAAMDTGNLGIVGAGMAAESAGSAYGEAEQLAQEAEKSGDADRAARIRAGRDLYAVTQAIVDTATERISPLHAFKTSGRGMRRLVNDMIQEGPVEEGAAGLIEGGLTRPLALGQQPDISQVPEAMIGGSIAAVPMAGGAMLLQNQPMSDGMAAETGGMREAQPPSSFAAAAGMAASFGGPEAAKHVAAAQAIVDDLPPAPAPKNEAAPAGNDVTARAAPAPVVSPPAAERTTPKETGGVTGDTRSLSEPLPGIPAEVPPPVNAESDVTRVNVPSPSNEGTSLTPPLSNPAAPSPVQQQSEAATPPIPLGLNRAAVVHEDLQNLSEEDFDDAYDTANKAIDKLEADYDNDPEKYSTNGPAREALAAAQDRYTAIQLERFRRNSRDVHPGDLFHEFTRLADKEGEPSQDNLQSENAAKMRILFDEIQRQKPDDKTLREGWDYVTGTKLADDADFKEVEAARFKKAKAWSDVFKAQQISTATTADENQTTTGGKTTDENALRSQEGRQGQGRQEGLLNSPAATPAQTAAKNAPSAPEPATVQSVVRGEKFSDNGTYDVQMSDGTKYKIFRDPENKWWYADNDSGSNIHFSERVLSTETKEDALKNLQERHNNGDSMLAKVAVKEKPQDKETSKNTERYWTIDDLDVLSKEGPPKKRGTFPRFIVKVDDNSTSIKTPKALAKFLSSIRSHFPRVFKNTGNGVTIDFDISRKESDVAFDERATQAKPERRGGRKLPKIIKTLNGPTGDKTQPHVLDYLYRNPIPLPPENVRKESGEWDWLGKGENQSVPFFWRQIIFNHTKAATKADVTSAIGSLAEAGYFPGIANPTTEDLGNLIKSGIAEYDKARSEKGAPTEEEQRESSAEQQRIDFEKATKNGPVRLDPHTLATGDKLIIEGERATVTSVNHDEDGYTTSFTIRDGTKFGVQTIDGEHAVYVDDYQPAERSAGEFAPEDLQAPKRSKEGGQSDMFAGKADEPFNLISETKEEREAREREEDRIAKKKADEEREAARREAEKNQAQFGFGGDDELAGARPGPELLTPATGPSAPVAPVKAVSEIIRDLAKGLELPIRFGRLTTSKFGGYFNKVRNLIATQRANELPTVAHEVGHKLDALFDLSRNRAIRAELDHLGDPSRPDSNSSWTPSKTLKYKYGEGIGEFIRYWLTEPGTASRLAPQTEAYFNGILDANPDFGDVMRQAQKDIDNWRHAPAEARLDSAISIGGNPNKTRYGLSQLTRDVVDDLHILRLAVDDVKNISGRGLPADQNPYILARLLRGSYGMADTFIRRGIVDFKTREVTPGTSLEDALKPISGEIDTFRRWLVAKRAQELEARGKETGLNRGDVATVASKHDSDPAFKAAFAKIKAWQDALLQYAVDAGYVTEDGAKAMRAMNQDYVPFHRVFEVGAGEQSSQQGEGGRGLNVGKAASLRRLKGSTRDIVDPLETMLKNAYVIITAAEKANINHAIAKLADKKGMGRWVEKIGIPKEGVRVPLEKIRQQLEDAGADLTGVPDDLLMQMYRPAGKAPYGENIIRIAGRDGKPTFYRLNGDLFDSFHALDLEESNKLIDILGKPANVLRAGVTLDPAFAASNTIRDAFGSAVINKYGLLPFQAGIEGAAAMIGNPKLVAEWAASGGSNAIEVNFFDREKMSAFLREKISKQLTPAEQASVVLKSPLTALRFLSGLSEEVTRIGEYKTAVKAAVKRGTPIGEARRLAAFESRDRQDFAKGGAKTKALRRIAAFWNASLQGNVKLYQSFKDRPVRTTIQALMYVTLPTVALMAQNYDDKDYWDRPQWERDAFWLIPHGKDANGHTKFIRIPKPFILGAMFGALPERMMAWHKTRDKKVFEGYMRNVAADLIPNPTPQVGQLLVADVLTGKQGWDIWRGRPVVDDRVAKLPVEQRWTEQTSLTARKIGEILGVSPMKVDHLIAGTTGGIGRLLTHQAIDRIIEAHTGEKRTASNTYLGSRFFTIPAGISSQSVEDFYKELDGLREKEAGARASVKLPPGTRLKSFEAQSLAAKFGYDKPRLDLMEKAADAMSKLQASARATDDPTRKQALYLKIRDIAELFQK